MSESGRSEIVLAAAGTEVTMVMISRKIYLNKRLSRQAPASRVRSHSISAARTSKSMALPATADVSGVIPLLTRV